MYGLVFLWILEIELLFDTQLISNNMDMVFEALDEFYDSIYLGMDSFLHLVWMNRSCFNIGLFVCLFLYILFIMFIIGVRDGDKF